MKQVALSKGQFALVDDSDYELVARKKWYAHYSSRTKSCYAYREERTTEGIRYSVPMHRFLLGFVRGDGVKVDHINHNTLDNRRENLRKATDAENSQNRRSLKKPRSGYKGVYPNRHRTGWTAWIKKSNQRYYLGHFRDREEAARAYDKAAKELFGEFAYLNFNGLGWRN